MKALWFRYVNHRGDDHEYVVIPTGAGHSRADGNEARCVLRGLVVNRDGSEHPAQIGSNLPARSFLLTDIKMIGEVEVT